MNSFPFAAVTNLYNFSGLKQGIFFLLLFWKSENQNKYERAKIKMSPGLIPLEALGKNLLFVSSHV